MSDLIWILPGAIAFVVGAYVIIKDELDGGPGDWMQ
jgi:hypothetical protein